MMRMVVLHYKLACWKFHDDNDDHSEDDDVSDDDED